MGERSRRSSKQRDCLSNEVASSGSALLRLFTLPLQHKIIIGVANESIKKFRAHLISSSSANEPSE